MRRLVSILLALAGLAAAQFTGSSQRFWHVLKNPGAATVTAAGATAPTVTAGKNNDGSDDPWLAETTTVTANSVGSVLTAYTITQGGWGGGQGIIWTALVKTGPDVTSQRLWAGLFSATPTASSAPNIHAAAFRYATDADGTAFWRCATIAGTGASAQVSTTTIPVIANTAYMLRIILTASSATFVVNDAIVATNTNIVPTSTTPLGCGTSITGLTTAVRYFLFSQMNLCY